MAECPPVRCSCSQYPVVNFSAEADDGPIFLGPGYVPIAIIPPLGSTWSNLGCLSLCQSTVSQLAVDNCAASQAAVCNFQPPVPPTIPTIDPPTTEVVTDTPNDGAPIIDGHVIPSYSNTAQTCQVTCPDGTVFSETIPAGAIVNNSSVLANSIAHSMACNQAALKRICLSEILDATCYNKPYSANIMVTGGLPPFTFAVSSGALPDGLSLTVINNRTVQISGTTSAAGNFTFTITATDADGKTSSKDYSIDVVGITTNAQLPDGHPGFTYDVQLDANGGTPDYRYEIFDGALPTGLTMDTFGHITGTPTQPEGFNLIIGVTDLDGQGITCKQSFDIEITGPVFLDSPPDGSECAAYNFQYHTDTVCTFTGTCPGGLKISASGEVTGCPSSQGPGTFEIVATDAQGNPGKKISTVNFTASVLAYPTAIKDFTYNPSSADAGCGVTTSLVAAGGDLSMTGFALRSSGVQPAFGQFGSNTGFRIVGGFGLCGCQAPYDVQVHVEWTRHITGGSSVPTLYKIEVILNSISVVSLDPIGTDSGSFDAVFPAASWPIPPLFVVEAFNAITMEYNTPLAVGEFHQVGMIITLRPLTPPP